MAFDLIPHELTSAIIHRVRGAVRQFQKESTHRRNVSIRKDCVRAVMRGHSGRSGISALSPKPDIPAASQGTIRDSFLVGPGLLLSTENQTSLLGTSDPHYHSVRTMADFDLTISTIALRQSSAASHARIVTFGTRGTGTPNPAVTCFQLPFKKMAMSAGAF